MMKGINKRTPLYIVSGSIHPSCFKNPISSTTFISPFALGPSHVQCSSYSSLPISELQSQKSSFSYLRAWTLFYTAIRKQRFEPKQWLKGNGTFHTRVWTYQRLVNSSHSTAYSQENAKAYVALSKTHFYFFLNFSLFLINCKHPLNLPFARHSLKSSTPFPSLAFQHNPTTKSIPLSSSRAAHQTLAQSRFRKAFFFFLATEILSF